MPQPRIMIVEDEDIVALDMKKSLTGLGYAVPAISSLGEDAVGEAAAIQPDLILMDIRLRGRMSGIDAALKIRTHLDIPIVYVTAYSDEATIEQAKVTRPYGFLLKPYKEGELRAAIEIALHNHQIEREERTSPRPSTTFSMPLSIQDIPPAFPDRQEADVDAFVRLPLYSEKTLDEVASTTWRLALISSDERLPPFGIEVFDDIMIGRQKDIEIDLDLTPYGAEALGVSRRHALLRPTPDSLYLFDQGSANGTFCNSERAWLGRPLPVSDGDVLSFGRLHLKVVILEYPGSSL